ncbi:MAG TPA: sigma-E factor regulatory protein RseB domain-containing protein [Streptosporangiaceae bacterium]
MPIPVYGSVGRRAVTVVVVAGLLILVLSNLEGSGGPAQPALRTAALAVPEPATMTVAAARSSRASTVGLRMLSLAATATKRVSYQGLQVISWRASRDGSWPVAGPSTVAITVSHHVGQSVSGEFGLTSTMLSLLSTHYDVVYVGTGAADGRTARVVEVLWPDGALAARFWLDSTTMLPLRRQLFDTQSHLVSQDDLAALKVGPVAVASAPGATSGFAMDTPAALTPISTTSSPVKAVASAQASPWRDHLGSAQLAAMQAQGWPALPETMPGGLTLFDVSESASAPGTVLDVAYSDGLSDVSVFVQRGQLPTALRDWRPTDMAGHPLYVRTTGEPDLTWSASGFVFTVVGGAPPSVIAGVVDQLPHQPGNGFWVRMNRGAHRLLSWVNPFR